MTNRRLALFPRIALTLACIAWPIAARANHFSVALDVFDGTSKQSAKTETEPPPTRDIVVRPAIQTTLGTRCTAKFKLTCTGKIALKDALVHFYVVRIDKAGQNPPPLEPKEVTIETAQTLDFAPGGTTSAEVEFKPDRAGIYLIRVETQNTAETGGHEHYAAMELTVREGAGK